MLSSFKLTFSDVCHNDKQMMNTHRGTAKLVGNSPNDKDLKSKPQCVDKTEEMFCFVLIEYYLIGD